MIDILSIEPNKISKSLKGKYVLIYSQPKGGKTTFASQFPNALLCAFEKGYHALPGVKPADIASWTDFKRVVTQLRSPKAQEMYDTVIIDTVSIATDLCEKYVCSQNDVSALGDIPYGQGWAKYRKEFDEPFREIAQLGYGIVFIAHNKEKPTEYKDKDGNTLSCVYPDLNKVGLNTVNRLVDIIGYLSVEFTENGESRRYLYTRQTPYIFAGSRYKYLAPKIEFGYQQLVDAITEAVDKENTMLGLAPSSDEDTVQEKVIIPERTFEEAMNEAKDLWTKLVAGGNVDNVKQIKEHIFSAFGTNLKLSEVTPDQLPQLEQVIQNMKLM